MKQTQERPARQKKKNRNHSGGPTAADFTAPVQKNDVIETQVLAQGVGGEGVVRLQDFPLFINGVLPGEKIRARVVRVNRSHGFARLEEVLVSSSDRVEPPCPYFGRCGGCDLQHQAYEAQLAFKTERVKDCFQRIGGFADPVVEPAIGMEQPWRYRNKVQMPIGRQDGEVRVGFYRGRSHEIIDIKECLIQNEPSDRIAEAVRHWIKEHIIPVLDREDEIIPGAVRHLLIREARYTGQMLVVLVATSAEVPHLEELVRDLRLAVPQIRGLVLNLNDAVTNRVLGEINHTVWGEATIEDTIGDIRYRISPHSFFQVNPEQTRRMYDKVVELAQLTGDEHVLDLYCGAGTIALYLARHAARVTGVEIVREAIADANYNKTLNNLSQVEFIHGKSEELIQQLMTESREPDLVVVDPPRKGCDESLLQAIGHSGIQRMIYVSCDPATLARDAKILRTFGFHPAHIQPYDNFPQTQHVETVVLMTRE
ncbi:23S rRNA (uracil-C(5))-methyltransferase RlmCD [anaerobic digester metagenome]